MMVDGMAHVVAVSRSDRHAFSKTECPSITLVAGQGVAGDAHMGETVQHRSRVRRDPTQPNLRQVHLIHRELFAALDEQGFTLGPGEIGENVTTAGIELLALPRGTRLHLGATAVIEVTGLRNPCHQLDDHQRGLMAALIERGPDGILIRKAGIMAIVLAGGTVKAGDLITIDLPPLPHQALEPV